MRAALTGFWLGFWVASITLSLWGIVYVNTHVDTPQWTAWDYWFWTSFTPLGLVAARLWKWVLTALLISLGCHEAHKLSNTLGLAGGLLVGATVTQPCARRGIQRGINSYGGWLTKQPAPAGSLAYSDRNVLRASCFIGAVIWCVAAAQFYPSTGTSYSQNTPVIHNGCVASTQN